MRIRKSLFYYPILFITVISVICGLLFTRVLSESTVHADSTQGVDIHKAIQQTAYAYYMRGPNIQYNSQKGNPSFSSPEETTSQNTNYLTCSAFVKNLYYDLLNVKTPPGTPSLLDYGEQYIGNPEVIMFGKTADNHMQMWVYDENSGSAVELMNPTTDELVKFLEIGDILTYTGHTMIVYDLIRDGNGNIVDAKIMESVHGGTHSITTKMPKQITIGDSISFGASNTHSLYLNSRDNPTFQDGLLEGSLHFSTFKTVGLWNDVASSKKPRYSILRFLTESDDGKIIFTYHGADYNESDYDGVEISLSQKVLDRLKFNNLYIEKTVDVFAESVVEPGDQLTYQIIIQNNSTSDYIDDIHVTENLSPYVNYDSYTANTTVSFTENLDENQLSWNIGRLANGESVIINYTVTVKDDALDQTIESTGMVENIQSAIIKNKVQQNLPANLADDIAVKFDELKDSYTGKQLIDAIYSQVVGTNLDISNLNIKELVKNTRPASTSAATVSLNTEHSLYNAVLNNYWGSLYEKKYTYNGEDIYAYDMKAWRAYDHPNRRADTIYQEHFKTGDVLLYTNHDDVTYRYISSSDTVTKTPVTNENGEYAYIYIEGRGFVGVNYGADGVPGTIDDRDDFSVDYYSDNGLYVYTNHEETDQDALSFMNYQTLFGKDYYVVLRPSMMLEIEQEDEHDSTEPTDDSESTDQVPATDSDDATTDGTNNNTAQDHIDAPNTGGATNSDSISGFGALSISIIMLIPAILFTTLRIKSARTNKK